MSDTKIIEQDDNPQEIPFELSQPVIPESVQPETEVAPERPIVIDGRECQTNLPEGVQLIKSDYKGLEGDSLIPNDFDALSPGKYYVHDHTTYRSIIVRGNKFGKTISNESFWRGVIPWLSSVSEDALGLMQALGFDVESAADGRDPSITGVPTPETIKAAAGLLGVEIQLLPETNSISGTDYLRAFADGKYPVSTKEYHYYIHDIGDDHLPAMVLGGEPLKLALAEVAARAITEPHEPDNIDVAASAIDSFTFVLRVLVLRPQIILHRTVDGQRLDDGNSLENARRTLIEVGEELGLTAEKTQEILQNAQETGRTMGLKVRELQ